MRILPLLFLLISANSFSQSIPKGCTKIQVPGVAFNQAINQLLDAGYFIDKADSAYGTIITLPRPIKSEQGNILLQVRVKDSTGIISGLFNQNYEINLFGANVDYKDYSAIEFRGMKGGALKNFFEIMDRFAKSFNKPVTYLPIE